MEEPDIIIADESNFELQVLEYSERLPVVVDFWAKWSKDCQRVSQQLEELALDHAGAFRLAQVNVDQNPQLVQHYQIRTVPTIKTFENGAVTTQLEGVRTNLQLIEYLKKVVPGPENLLLEKAASHLAGGQYRSAEDVCLEVLEEDPDNPVAKLLLAKTLIRQKEYLEALTLLNHFPTSREYQAAQKLIPLCEALLTTRQETNSDQPLDLIFQRALQLIENDSIPAGLDGLLEIVRRDKKYQDGSPRLIILGVFQLLGEKHPLTEEYRQLLASALF